MVRVADVEDPQAGEDEAARDDARVVALRHGAVVAGVALRGAVGAGVAGCCARLRGLVDLEPDVGDDLGLGLVGDVDDARGADGPTSGLAARRVLVDLDEVRMPADRHRDGGLRRAHVVPRELAEIGDLGSALALLHLADVEDRQALRRRVAARRRRTGGCRRR